VGCHKRGPGDRLDEHLLQRLDRHGRRGQEGRSDRPHLPGAERTETALDAATVTKKVYLSIADPAKTVIIGDNLGEK
jgi:hypothetical protein